MNPVSRILAGVDFHGETGAVVEKAARLASALGADLELFAPVYNSQVSRANFPAPGAMETARERLVRKALERLDALASGLGGAVEIHCEAAWDHPREEALIRRAVNSRADLVVAAVQAHPEHMLTFLSGGDWQLVRHCPAPLLMCLPGEWKHRPVVVAALDPVHHHARNSDLDVRILQAAEILSTACGGSLRALHAFEAIVEGAGELIELPVDRAEESLEHGRARALEAVFVAAGVRPGLLDMEHGSPRELIPAYCARHGADVVVMGAIARNPLGRIFIGSTAERVLHHLPCDLLVIKPEGFRTPVASQPYDTEEAGAGHVIGVPGI